MSYEKPQKGNPHGLVIKQHTLPAATLERFADHSGRIQVKHLRTGKVLRVRPDDQLFCALRLWDQRAESGYMKSIEDEFQTLATSILNGTVRIIGGDEKRVVDEFYALWNTRMAWKNNRIPDQPIHNIIGPARELSKNDQEVLERKHCGFVLPNGALPGRQITGLRIQIEIGYACDQLKNHRWGIFRSTNADFLVPDRSFNYLVVPVSPNVCIVGPTQNRRCSRKDVAQLNVLTARCSEEYYFARDFERCAIQG